MRCVKLTFCWFLSETNILAVVVGRSFVIINRGETSTYNKGLAWLGYYNKGSALFIITKARLSIFEGLGGKSALGILIKSELCRKRFKFCIQFCSGMLSNVP